VQRERNSKCIISLEMNETTRTAQCGCKTNDGTSCNRVLKPGATKCWQHASGVKQFWKAIGPWYRGLAGVIALVGSLSSIWPFVQSRLKPRPPSVSITNSVPVQPDNPVVPETTLKPPLAQSSRGPNIGIVGGHGKNNFDHVRVNGADIGIIAPGQENTFKNTEIIAPKRTPPTVIQESHGDRSPNVATFGDNSPATVTINPDVNPYAPVVTFEYTGIRHTTTQSPNKTVADDENTAVFSKMVSLFSTGDWNGVTDLGDSQIQKTPGWLTPYMISGLAYANMCNRDKAIELLQYVEINRNKADQRYTSKYDESAEHLRHLLAGELPDGCKR
jgi:hypothetical protein